ncbi:MAG: 30S ribosomal protein S17 [Phycisphaeraceae bacterium]
MSETNTKKVTGTKVGFVTSSKRDKTRTVAVEYQKVHAKYGKRLRRQAKFQVHDESNDSNEGDRVEIAQCRPLSKTKSWRLVKVLERAPEAVQHNAEAPTAE